MEPSPVDQDGTIRADVHSDESVLRSAWLQEQTRNRGLITSRRCRVPSDDTHPQSVHTVSTRCPPPLHSLPSPYTPCGCRPLRPAPTVSPVRPTPLYDQLRGERINADIPPSDAQAQQVEDRGKHRLAHGELRSVTACTQPPRTTAHRANADVSPREADPQQRGHPAKHHLPDDEPGLAATFTRPPPAADPAANWSWFATAETMGVV